MTSVGLPVATTFPAAMSTTSLHAAATSVDEADLGEPCLRSFSYVFLNKRRDVGRRERMKIELALNRHAQRVLVWRIAHTRTNAISRT